MVLRIEVTECIRTTELKKLQKKRNKVRWNFNSYKERSESSRMAIK